MQEGDRNRFDIGRLDLRRQITQPRLVERRDLAPCGIQASANRKAEIARHKGRCAYLSDVEKARPVLPADQ
jgi:hypothetical protein